MSNRSGGLMLNEVLKLLDERGLFSRSSRESLSAMAREIVELAHERYDCNAEEILGDLESGFGVCFNCLCPTDEPTDGLCAECHKDCYG
jgi:hypothetical protein